MEKSGKRRSLWLVIAVLMMLVIGYGIWYVANALPIISAYGAKNLCSGVFVSGRPAEEVIDQELGTTLSSLGSYSVNASDSSASGSVFSLFRKKAIYRKGLGCTLVNEVDEEVLRSARYHLPVQAQHWKQQADTTMWPSGNRMPDKLPSGADTSVINRFVDEAFVEKDPEHPVRTRAVLVVYQDTVIAEKYAAGFGPDMPLCGWSMTKSITNAMLGILVKDGKLNLDEPAPIKEWQSDDRRSISLRVLMQASSGLEWEENYAGPSDATRMLFMKADAGGFAAQKQPEYAPGTVFEYSSGTTNILSLIVRQTVGENDYHQFPYSRLFQIIGMQQTTLEPDASGTFVGSSYSYGTARDWARFGLLYLHDGVWQGQRILPEGWVKFSSTPTPPAERGEYGAQWWLNAGQPSNPADRTYPDVPADSFQAEGFEGQYVFVIPSHSLVVVRLGLTQSGEFNANRLVSGIISGIKKR